MTNLSPEICIKIRNARREAGISQSALAREVGCNQSALSMFEQGAGTKLGEDVIKKLAGKFGIEIAPAAGERVGAAKGWRSLGIHKAASGFCPNPACPSNHIYIVEGMRLARPDREACDPVGGKFCAVCGEVLERECPNCGAPVHAGAICSLCGEQYVTGLKSL